MFIDPHVHCRDWAQSNKETVKHALSVAERAGFSAIFDMSNTDPPITKREHVIERLKLAKDAPIFYGLYIAMTANTDQIKEAVETFNEFPQVVGFKLYAGHSVGDIGVTNIKDQERVYTTLTDMNYKGVISVHCEKENLLKRDLWNPKDPITHTQVRPPEAEVISVRDQIALAKNAEFKGNLHVTHITTPEAVELVQSVKKYLRVTCGATPHHLVLDSSKMQETNGLWYKMNPPLRPRRTVDKLFQQLKAGKIDWIETDHAPHTTEEKMKTLYMSGIPMLHVYPRFIEWLRKSLSETQIRDLTFNNIKKVFGLDVKPRNVTPALDLSNEYPFDPFKDIF